MIATPVGAKIKTWFGAFSVIHYDTEAISKVTDKLFWWNEVSQIHQILRKTIAKVLQRLAYWTFYWICLMIYLAQEQTNVKMCFYF